MKLFLKEITRNTHVQPDIYKLEIKILFENEEPFIDMCLLSLIPSFSIGIISSCILQFSLNFSYLLNYLYVFTTFNVIKRFLIEENISGNSSFIDYEKHLENSFTFLCCQIHLQQFFPSHEKHFEKSFIFHRCQTPIKLDIVLSTATRPPSHERNILRHLPSRSSAMLSFSSD